MKKHYAKRLKEENEKLLSDIYAILDGDLMTAQLYRGLRKAKQDTEKLVWFGNPLWDQRRFEGIISKMTKNARSIRKK